MTLVHERTLWRGSDVLFYKTDRYHCMCAGKMCEFQGAHIIFEMVNNAKCGSINIEKKYRIFTIRDG